jgi:hypothetical protein
VETLCETTREALHDGVATTLISASRSARMARLIVGIAPDHTHTVIADTKGHLAQIPVSGGVFLRQDGATNPPDTLRLLRAPG